MTLVSELKRQWMQVPAFKAEYDALENEFSLARELIEARTRAGLSQTELAQRMGTTQSTIARLANGKKMARLRRPCEPLRVSLPLSASCAVAWLEPHP